MADENFSDLKSLAEMAVEYLDLLATSTQKLNEAQTENTEYLNLLVDATKEQTKASKDNKKATDEETKAKKRAASAVNILTNFAKAAGREFLNSGNAGIKLGSSLGISATKGVQLEVSNRAALIKQLANFNTDLAVTMEQLQATQQGFADAFVGLREGTQLSARGSIAFASDLKKGFKSEFTPTAETFRILTQMGISTTAQMDALRRGTGRASLSANQLSTLYNKNQLSFLLYGNSFGKAAVQAERLGINLASVQAAQEGLVTNLDGTIDTVAQINQLGGQIDFGNLVRVAEQEGPDALMAYVRSTVPANLMQSASTRALFKQLGISVEDYLKSGNKQISAADQLEKRMTEAATGASTFEKSAAALARTNDILNSTFGELKTAVQDAIMGLGGFVKDLITAGLTARLMASRGGTPTTPTTPGAPGTPAPKPSGGTIKPMLKGGAAGGAAVGAVTGVFDAIQARQGGAGWAKTVALGVAPILGGALGGILGGAISAIPFLTPFAPVIVPLFGGLGAQLTSSLANKIADDMISTPGYGGRVLLTPKGSFSLNNNDTVLAGTNLFNTGATNNTSSEASNLIRKVNELITVLQTATTTVNVNNTVQQVPRMAMVGVYSRNERV